MSISAILFISLATLLLWWSILPIANSLNIPIGEAYGVISYAVLNNRSPLTNVAIYLLLLLIPSLIIFIFTTLRHQFLEISFKGISSNLFKLTERKVFPFFIVIGILIWSINVTVGFITPSVAQDTFHFGEKIGLTEAFFQSPRAFFSKGFLMIHGFGLNVLPGIVGWLLGGRENDIAFSLLTVYIQALFAILFSFLCLYEIASFVSRSHRWKVLFLLSAIYFSLYGKVFVPIDRDTIFMVQSWLILRWLRLDMELIQDHKEEHKPHLKILIFTIGFLLPLSIIYVYDRAVYSLVTFLFLIFYVHWTQPKNNFVKNVFLSCWGVLSASLIISIILGFDTLPTSLDQIRYWSKVSGLFTSLPYPQINISIDSLINWLPIFLQSITLTILVIKLRAECFISSKKLKVFLIENSIPIFLLLCAVLLMRVALGRSDGGHLISPGFFAIFAFVALVGRFFVEKKILQNSRDQVFVALLIATISFNMSSIFTAVDFRGVLRYLETIQTFTAQTNDRLISSAYLDVAKQIKPELNEQSCFYTLTSEGLWYRLLNKQPCSRYWYLIYSTTTESQEELIQDLEASKPRLILYSNSTLGNGIDGIWKEISHLLVHQYIWQNYRPYKLIGDQWFWVRRQQPIDISDLLVSSPRTLLGSFGSLVPEQTIQSNIIAKGWMLPKTSPIPGENNVVLLTYHPVGFPRKHLLLGLARTTIDRPDIAAKFNRPDALQSGWNITFNQLSLPDTPVKVRAWAYNPEDQKFYLLPKGHVLKPEKA